jgi:hypothetical protein
MSIGYDGVMKLQKERPEWLPIVKLCAEMAEGDKQFAGSWVVYRAGGLGLSPVVKLREPDTYWLPSLKLLVSYGILRHEFSTRGKRRAYYSMPDRVGVKKALNELRVKNIITK